MNRKILNILSVGAITMLTASSMLPVHALSKNTCIKTHTYKKTMVYRKVYICVNGVKFELPLTPSCPNVPSKPEVTPDVPNTTPSIPGNSDNENNNNNNNNTENNSGSTEEKPNTTPSKPDNSGNENNNNNSNNNNNTENNSGSTEEKPSTTPNTNNSDFASYQQQVLELVNKERSKNGLSPLTLDYSLSNVATKKSQDMINKNYFDHTSPTYGSPFDMMKQFGISYRSAGENIAKGQRTPQEVMNEWMNSAGHRANILNSSFTKLGVGIAKDSNGTLYWTQMFIG